MEPEPLDIEVIRSIFNDRDKVINRAAVYGSELRRTTERVSQIKAEIRELQSDLQAAEEEESRLSDCFKAYEAMKESQAIRDAECKTKLLDLARNLPKGTLIKIESLYDARLFCRWEKLAKRTLQAAPLIVYTVSEEQTKKIYELFSSSEVTITPIRQRRFSSPPPSSPHSSEKYDTGNWRQKKD